MIEAQLQFSICISVLKLIILKRIFLCHHPQPPSFVGFWKVYIPSPQIFDDISVMRIFFHFRPNGTFNLIIKSTAHLSFHLCSTDSISIYMPRSRTVAECKIELRHNAYPTCISACRIDFVQQLSHCSMVSANHQRCTQHIYSELLDGCNNCQTFTVGR